jgi:hypothetical protein
MEVFTNCSTSATSFLNFYLLLNGSGVGRCYDDDMMLVNWDYAPNIRVVLDTEHPDFVWGTHESVRDARHKYGSPEEMEWFTAPTANPETGKIDWAGWQAATEYWQLRVSMRGGHVGQPCTSGDRVVWFQVPDSREGWAKALELWETYAFEKIHKDTLLILDFSAVRPKNMPIGGMQNRPASGPVPLMNSFLMAASIKGSGNYMEDTSIAQTILAQIGGSRRLAIMTGAKNFMAHKDGLSFRLPHTITKGGINHIQITLTPADTYDVTFNKIRGLKVTQAAFVEGVYCDNLKEIIADETGLALSL